MRVLRWVLPPVLLLLAVLLQLTLAARLPLPGPAPNVVLLVVVALALTGGPLPGALAGFAGGFALDLVPPADTAAGRWAFALCLVGYLGGLAVDAANQSLLVPLGVVAAASVATLVLYTLLGTFIGDIRVTWAATAALLPLAVLYDLLLTPLVLPAVFALMRRARPTRRGAVPSLSVYS